MPKWSVTVAAGTVSLLMLKQTYWLILMESLVRARPGRIRQRRAVAHTHLGTRGRLQPHGNARRDYNAPRASR